MARNASSPTPISPRPSNSEGEAAVGTGKEACKGTRKKALAKSALLAALALLVLGAAWFLWSENHPEQERELRVMIQERLLEWFPDEMALPEGMVGFVPRSVGGPDAVSPEVVLVHGLDEPGGVWDDLVAALAEAGVEVWEFRYPNDQGIDSSADLLAERWPELDPDSDIFLVGHSMGGLVIRDFLTRWRYPREAPAPVEGASVAGVVLVGTPNQGSDWARLRIWLQMRQSLADARNGNFTLFAGLRDGTGAAKIDLRPGSAFLEKLNSRPWPEHVPLKIIGGVLAEPTEEMLENLRHLSEELGVTDLGEHVEHLWSRGGDGLGDGAVPVQSLYFEGGPEPTLVQSTHRGLLASQYALKDPPPAIQLIVEQIELWRLRQR